MEKFVINIGRQLGSGGRGIGQALAERYKIQCYDKELIRIASEKSGLCPELFEKADEKNQRSIISGFFGGIRFPFSADAGLGQGYYLNNDTLFKIQSDVIRQLAQKESCVFVGRCADYILRDHPRCVNIFITASDEDRIARIRNYSDVSEEKAISLMEEIDKKRASYYNFYTTKEWGYAASYDLCINSSRLGLTQTIQFIEAFIQKTLHS